MKNIGIKILNKKGISLVEVLVTLAIFSMMSASLYAAMSVGQNSWETNRVHIELQQEMRKAMEAMINDLRQASNSSIINVPADNQWYPTITFRKPTGVTSGSIVWDANTLQFVKGGTDSDQLLRVYNGTTKIMCQYLDSMQFRRQSMSSNTLEVVLRAEDTTTKGVVIGYDLSFNVELRNR